MFKKITTSYKWAKNYLIAHKIIGTVVILVVLFGGYKLFTSLTSTTGQPRYVTAAVERGTVVVAVTGTGQVSASNQFDLKPKVSGDIVALPVKSGQAIKRGTLIAALDARDAEISLDSARLALAKLTKPADDLTMLQAQNAVADAAAAAKQANIDLAKADEDGFNAMTSTFLDLPSIDNGINGILNDLRTSPYFSDSVGGLSPTALGYKDTAAHSYALFKEKYDQALKDYRQISRFSATSTVEAMIKETYETTQAASQALKDLNTGVSFVINQTDSASRTTAMTTDTANINSWNSKVSSHLTDLSSIQTSLINSRATIDSSARTIAEKNTSLTKLVSGADPLDIQSAELDVKQKEYAYQDYFIRAPFDGVVGKLNVKLGDAVSGTSLGTFISNQQVADISLNEVDVSKIKVGQKATLTFDAVDGLTLTGQVIEVDLIGTVSQGVVTYNVKIGLDTNDDRVKSGMSVSAAIVTDVKPDVLTVPNSAIKSRGAGYYVEMFNPPLADSTSTAGVVSATLPNQQTVELGLANDTVSEIISGLKEGDQVVVRTITATTKTTTSAPSLFGAATGRAGAGGTGAVRATTGR